MAYDSDRLRRIFDRTAGRCHLCHGALAFGAYTNGNHWGGWEVEHGIPRAAGGTDHLNNLWPAHIPCNRSKGIQSTRSVRAANGYTRSPMSIAEQAGVRQERAIVGGLAVGLLGLVLAARANAKRPAHEQIDPLKALLAFAVFGAAVGHSLDPE